MQDMIVPAFKLVHENNMRKLGPDGKPIFREDGKIIKPEGFEKVELKTLFEK
jgi:predicted HAD superfamily Cof-like phosphohydrolase